MLTSGSRVGDILPFEEDLKRVEPFQLHKNVQRAMPAGAGRYL